VTDPEQRASLDRVIGTGGDDKAAKLARTNEWNRRLEAVAKATGRDEMDIVGEMSSKANESHAAQLAAMDKMIADHGDKPKAWEPEDHLDPKNFETFDGETPEEAAARKASWESRWAVRQKFRDGLADAANLTNEKRRGYLEETQTVLDYMPPKALDAMTANVRKINFYRSTKDIDKWINDTRRPGEEEVKAVGGVWVPDLKTGEGELHIAGGTSYASGREIYAHEFGHACDWRTDRNGAGLGPISKTSLWLEAFSSELASEKLGKYAAKNPIEGFAEFARLCWGTGESYSAIEAEYPKSFAVFKKYGLVGK
jgi:hypothetical protein